MFEVFIVDSNGNKSILKVEKSYTISKTKELIKKEKNICGDIELVFNGSILEDNDTLETYNISDGNTLNFLGQFKAGGFGVNMADISNEKGLVKKTIVVMLKNGIKLLKD